MRSAMNVAVPSGPLIVPQTMVGVSDVISSFADVGGFAGLLVNSWLLRCTE